MLDLQKTGLKHNEYFYRSTWIQLTRPLTFTGTICPILAGTGFASIHENIQFGNFILLLVAALLIQAATNMLNDYYDFKNGQDCEKWLRKEISHTEQGPAHKTIPIMAGVLIGIAIVLGAWLAFFSSLWIILAGVLGIMFGFLYSAGSKPLCSIGMGELVAFVFLGFVTTTLSYVVQGNPVDGKILALSLPFALLIASMILTNNIRDMEKDLKFRRTIAILLGYKNAVRLLTTLLSLAYIWTVSLTFSGIIPWSTIVILFSLPFAVKLRWSFRQGTKRTEVIKAMKWAAYHYWMFGLLFAAGLWIA